MAFRRATRIGVVVLFVALLTAFVAFRSGAFDRQIQRWLAPRPSFNDILIDSPPAVNHRKDLTSRQSDAIIEKLQAELIAKKYQDDSLLKQYQFELMARAVRNYYIEDSIAKLYDDKPYTTDTTTLFLIPFHGSKSAYLITGDHISQFTEAEKKKLHLIRMARKMEEEGRKADSVRNAEEEKKTSDISKPVMLPGSKSISPMIDPSSIKIDPSILEKIISSKEISKTTIFPSSKSITPMIDPSSLIKIDLPLTRLKLDTAGVAFPFFYGRKRYIPYKPITDQVSPALMKIKQALQHLDSLSKTK